MNLDKRIDTISLLINSNPAITSSKVDIEQDLKVVKGLKKMQPLKRRNLSRIFFSSRAIDTSLRAFLDHYGIRGKYEYSIGKYLDKLNKHSLTSISNISINEKEKYKRRIAYERNIYLHKANSYPNSNNDVMNLLSEIHALIARVNTL